MKRVSTTSTVLPPTNMGAVGKAWDEMSASFDRFCLAAGVEALGAMMEKDAEEVCGARHARSDGRRNTCRQARSSCLHGEMLSGRSIAQKRSTWRAIHVPLGWGENDYIGMEFLDFAQMELAKIVGYPIEPTDVEAEIVLPKFMRE